MGIETVLAATAIAGTGASLYGQNKARKDAKKQNEKSRKDSILSEIMSIVSGQGPQGINPQQQVVPQVDYGEAVSGLAQMGYGMHRDSVEDTRNAQLDARNAQLAESNITNNNMQNALLQGRAYEQVFGPISSRSSLAPAAPQSMLEQAPMTYEQIKGIAPENMTPEQIEFLRKYKALDQGGLLEGVGPYAGQGFSHGAPMTNNLDWAIQNFNAVPVGQPQ